MSLDICRFESYQNELLDRFEQELEQDDDQRFERTHGELAEHFASVPRIAATPQDRSRIEALVAAGQAREQRILDYWAAQADA